MWTSLFFGLPNLVSGQEDEIYEDEAVVTDSVDEVLGTKMPSTEELLKMVDSMELPEEEKRNLLESIMKGLPGLPVAEDGVEAETEKAFALASDFFSQTLVLLALLSLISLIFETILEKFKNSKVLSEEMQEKLSSLVNRYSELKDEEKSEFKENAKDIFKKAFDNLLTNSSRQNKWLMWLADRHLIFLFAILIVIFVFVFFGYKLYKSLSERERKREEKRRLKQMKKKK